MGQTPSSVTSPSVGQDSVSDSTTVNSSDSLQLRVDNQLDQQTPTMENQEEQHARQLSIQLSTTPPPSHPHLIQRAASESSSQSSFELIHTPNSAISNTSSHRSTFELVKGSITRTPSIEVVGSPIDRVESFPSTPLIASKSNSYALITPTLTLSRQPSIPITQGQLDQDGDLDPQKEFIPNQETWDEDEEKYPADEQQEYTSFADFPRPDYLTHYDYDTDEDAYCDDGDYHDEDVDVILTRASWNLRQRHQSKLGDHASIKSRRTRKQRKEENALTILQRRNFQKQQQVEYQPLPTPVKPIVYPYLSILDIQSYFLQLYSAKIMKQFHTGVTQVLSIQPVSIEFIRNFFIASSSFQTTVDSIQIHLLPRMSCMYTNEGLLQQQGCTLKQRDQLDLQHQQYLTRFAIGQSTHTPELCRKLCRDRGATFYTFDQTKKLVKDFASAPRWTTVMNKFGRPIQVQTDVHIVELCARLSPFAPPIPLVEIEFQRTPMHHFKGDHQHPDRQHQRQQLVRELNKRQRERADRKTLKSKRSQKTRTESRHHDRAISTRLSAVDSILEVELHYFTDEEVYQYENYRRLHPNECPHCLRGQSCCEPVTLTVEAHCLVCLEDCICCEYGREDVEQEIWHTILREQDHLFTLCEQYDEDVLVGRETNTTIFNSYYGDRYDIHGTQTNLGPRYTTKQTFGSVNQHPCRTRHRQELGQKKGGKKTRKEMKELKALFNQNRKDLAQQLKTQAITNTLRKVDPDRLNLPPSVTDGGLHQPPPRKKATRGHHKHNNSRKPRQNYSTKPHGASKSQKEALLPANVFKNHRTKKDKKKVIHLRDLSRALVMNAAKVESGELKLTPNKPFIQHHTPPNYSTTRAFLSGFKNGRDTSRPFHRDLWDLLQFDTSFVQLFRTRIEQSMQSVQTRIGMGVRVVEIGPNRGPNFWQDFFNNLLQDLNSYRVGVDHPPTTELELRFYSCTQSTPHETGLNYCGYSAKNLHHLFVSGQETLDPNEDGDNSNYRRLCVKAFLKGGHPSPIDHINHYDVGSSQTVIPVAEVKYQLIPLHVPFRSLKSKPIRSQLKRIKEQQNYQLKRKKATRLRSLDRTYGDMIKNELAGPWTRFHGFDCGHHKWWYHTWTRLGEVGWWNECDDILLHCYCERREDQYYANLYVQAADRLRSSFSIDSDEEDDPTALPRISIGPNFIHPNSFQALFAESSDDANVSGQDYSIGSCSSASSSPVLLSQLCHPTTSQLRSIASFSLVGSPPPPIESKAASSSATISSNVTTEDELESEGEVEHEEDSEELYPVHSSEPQAYSDSEDGLELDFDPRTLELASSFDPDWSANRFGLNLRILRLHGKRARTRPLTPTFPSGYATKPKTPKTISIQRTRQLQAITTARGTNE